MDHSAKSLGTRALVGVLLAVAFGISADLLVKAGFFITFFGTHMADHKPQFLLFYLGLAVRHGLVMLLIGAPIWYGLVRNGRAGWKAAVTLGAMLAAFEYWVDLGSKIIPVAGASVTVPIIINLDSDAESRSAIVTLLSGLWWEGVPHLYPAFFGSLCAFASWRLCYFRSARK